jgi:hypothetical protein
LVSRAVVSLPFCLPLIIVSVNLSKGIVSLRWVSFGSGKVLTYLDLWVVILLTTKMESFTKQQLYMDISNILKSRKVTGFICLFSIPNFYGGSLPFCLPLIIVSVNLSKGIVSLRWVSFGSGKVLTYL